MIQTMNNELTNEEDSARETITCGEANADKWQDKGWNVYTIDDDFFVMDFPRDTISGTTVAALEILGKIEAIGVNEDNNVFVSLRVSREPVKEWLNDVVDACSGKYD